MMKQLGNKLRGLQPSQQFHTSEMTSSSSTTLMALPIHSIKQSIVLNTQKTVIILMMTTMTSGIISMRNGSGIYSLIMQEIFCTTTPTCQVKNCRKPLLMQMKIFFQNGSDVISATCPEKTSKKRSWLHSNTSTVRSSSKSLVNCRSKRWSITSMSFRRNMDPFSTMSGPKMKRCTDSELLLDVYLLSRYR